MMVYNPLIYFLDLSSNGTFPNSFPIVQRLYKVISNTLIKPLEQLLGLPWALINSAFGKHTLRVFLQDFFRWHFRIRIL